MLQSSDRITVTLIEQSQMCEHAIGQHLGERLGIANDELPIGGRTFSHGRKVRARRRGVIGTHTLLTSSWDKGGSLQSVGKRGEFIVVRSGIYRTVAGLPLALIRPRAIDKITCPKV